MFQMSLPRGSEQVRELSPGIGGAHIDNPHCLNASPGRLDTKEPRRLTGLNAAPELFLCGEQKVLVKRVGRKRDLDPLAAAGDDGQHTRLGVGHPHVVLQLGQVFFRGRFLRECPGQHELGLEHRPGGLDAAVKRCRHVPNQGMPDVPLYVDQDLPGVALIPMPVQRLGHHAKLNNEVVGQVFRARPRRASPAIAGAGRSRPIP